MQQLASIVGRLCTTARGEHAGYCRLGAAACKPQVYRLTKVARYILLALWLHYKCTDSQVHATGSMATLQVYRLRGVVLQNRYRRLALWLHYKCTDFEELFYRPGTCHWLCGYTTSVQTLRRRSTLAAADLIVIRGV